MNDDSRTLRILLEKAQLDVSAAVFQLGESQAALAAKNTQLKDAQTALARVNTQLETITASLGANQRYVHLNKVSMRAAATSSLAAVEIAQAIPTVVLPQGQAGTAPASPTR